MKEKIPHRKESQPWSVNIFNRLERLFHFDQFPKLLHFFCLFIVLVFVWFAMSPVLQNQLTNWDDTNYIKDNSLIISMNLKNINDIFSKPVMGNYHPLTILSYAIEYRFAGLDPWLYHFDNLIIHLLIVCAIYWFVFQFTQKVMVACLVALLFGIHPMHVESVAWVSDRKDLLMTFFYLSAGISYIYYINDKKRNQYYVLTFVLFLFSILSKPVAVTFPFILLMADYLMGMKQSLKAVLEKVPFFILSIIFGLIAIRNQKEFGSLLTVKENFNFLERLMLGNYSLVTYLWKSVIPINLSCFYAYPLKVNGGMSFIYYLYIFATVALVLIIIKYFRNDKQVIFGAVFFLLNISLLLQFIPVGNVLIAERYSYLPYIGLLLLFSKFIVFCFNFIKPVIFRALSVIVVLSIVLSFSFMSRQRCSDWYDSISLWNHEMEHQPKPNLVVFSNLGSVYFNDWYNAPNKADRKANYVATKKIHEEILQNWPGEISSYQVLAMLYVSSQKYDSAEYYLRTSLQYDSSATEYENYGNFLLMIGYHEGAVKIYSIAMSKNPDLFELYLNRGKAYRQLNKWNEAFSDFNAGIEINGRSGALYYERSFCDTQKGLRNVALQDVNKAISLGFKNIDTVYYNQLMH